MVVLTTMEPGQQMTMPMNANEQTSMNKHQMAGATKVGDNEQQGR